MKTKYGIIFYKGTSNIGDDIQTYAAKRFLPQIDYVIERERLDSFIPNDMEKVKVIMNGWYFHISENWPPTPFIDPKLISMHFTDNMRIQGWNVKNDHVFEGFGKKFFEDHQPIGCRDQHTQQLMNKLKVKNYFSSCLTTTISLDIETQKEDVIYVVDVSDEIVDYIKAHTNYRVKRLTHYLSKDDQNKSFEERMNNVEQLLTKYKNARMVVTRRLHAALPCLALNTPVLLIKYDDPDYKGRLDTFYNFVHCVSEEELLKEKVSIDFNKIKNNPNKFKKYRDKLISDCEKFIITPQKQTKVSYEEYISWSEKTKEYQKNNFRKIIFEENEKINKQEQLIKQAYERIENLETKLNSIYSSRSYRWTKAVKNIVKR